MSEVKTGLAALKKFQEEQRQKAADRERPKGEWFKWPSPKVNVAEALFLQELDEAAAGYTEERGLGAVVVEHNAPGPEGYKRRGLCTLDSEGQCYPDERHALRIEEEKGGWRQRHNLYINALVKFEGSEKWEHVIISRNANSTFTESLIQEAIDEGTITSQVYRVTRTGSGTQTQWLLKGLPKAELPEFTGEVFDLEATAFRRIPYEKQAEYYGAVYSGPEGTAPVSESSAPAAPQAATDEW